MKHFEDYMRVRGSADARLTAALSVQQCDILLAGYVAYLHGLRAQPPLAPGTIGGYLAAVRSVHRVDGRALSLDDTPRTGAALRGVYNVVRHQPRRVAALLPEALAAFARSPDGATAGQPTPVGRQPALDRVLFIMAATQLLGLLRFGEAGYTDKETPVLRRSDVRFLPGIGVHLHLRRAKTERLAVRQHTIIGHPSDAYTEFDVPRMIAELMVRRPLSTDKPLFATDAAGTRAVSRAEMNAFVQRVAVASGARYMVSKDVKFSAHSWRAGGATAMRAAGADAEQIQYAGRWRSFCFAIYTADRDQELARTACLITRNRSSVVAAER
jgi:integrase